ncbi:MAG: serine/threonine protein kinase, partial [Holophagales bacterium]|nr:serine/threonine protein kinase [Holophagales bacterium]
MTDDPLRLPGYQHLAPLGSGGMGRVYRVRHSESGEVRVAKILHRDLRQDPRLVARFEREVKLLLRLPHPNLVRLSEVCTGSHGETALVMELVEGITLGSLRRRLGSVPLASTLTLGHQAAGALRHLHGHGWVHRDVSPDNLMVRLPAGLPEPREPPGVLQLVLLDLGIAKSMATAAGGAEGDTIAPLTATGAFLGKMRYAAPEQLRGQELTGRSDLYSLGVVLYEMLTGRYPIEGHDTESWMAGHLLYPPKPFEEADGLPEPVCGLVLRLLAKDPEARPAHAAALERELEALGTLHRPSAAERKRLAAAVLEGVAEITERLGAEAEEATLTSRRAGEGRSPRALPPSPALPPAGRTPAGAPPAGDGSRAAASPTR